MVKMAIGCMEDHARFETVARVTAGLAHDFVNVLTLVLASAELIACDESISDDALERAHVIEGAARHAARLADRLAQLARGSELERRPIDLGRLVIETAELIERIVGSRIHVAMELHASPCYVTADPLELEQILLNLVFNARDAMPDGGELVISVALDGDQVVLGVRDTGTGMPADIVARVFEPAFTTKTRGRGMGLAVVLRVVDESRGRISIASRPGAGTTIQIHWPA